MNVRVHTFLVVFNLILFAKLNQQRENYEYSDYKCIFTLTVNYDGICKLRDATKISFIITMQMIY